MRPASQAQSVLRGAKKATNRQIVVHKFAHAAIIPGRTPNAPLP
jgi:hypothetical protein